MRFWFGHKQKNSREPAIVGQINPQDVWTKNIVHLTCPDFNRHPLYPISQFWPELLGLLLRPPEGWMRFLMKILFLLCLGGISSIGKCAKKISDPIFSFKSQEVNLLYFLLFACFQWIESLKTREDLIDPILVQCQ